MNFKANYRDLQELVRELHLVRAHNFQIKEMDSQVTALFFAEAALVTIVLERFVRIVLKDAKDTETLFPLLQRAVKKGLIILPWEDQQDGIRKICGVRNTLLHGNYEQAAKDAGYSSVPEYFKNVFLSEVEQLFDITNDLFKQINSETGERL